MRTARRFLNFDTAGQVSEDGPIVLRPGERLASVQMLDASPTGTAIGSGVAELKGSVGGGQLQSFSSAATFDTTNRFRLLVGDSTWGAQPYAELVFECTAAAPGYRAAFLVRLTEAEV